MGVLNIWSNISHQSIHLTIYEELDREFRSDILNEILAFHCILCLADILKKHFFEK